ncbi:dihydroxyacetone phosphate acyltransferase-like protein [Labeo rohita]|uniref:Dihydroxyacetone phosphate acyltransferase-like protein n=1 Tax=Labeo rohita TaxID=84645 RepID=A0A498L4F0_LABRO|nr:dihydroxyacetone phosphate acyltransferase-like protein [Labeo rohita]
MQKLRAATDFALRATKVTVRSLGQVMSMLVVQERHLWLNLAQMADVDKARFLDSPVSQAGLFSDTVEDFAQQVSAVQKQTEAIKHILPRRETTRKSLHRGPRRWELVVLFSCTSDVVVLATGGEDLFKDRLGMSRAGNP